MPLARIALSAAFLALLSSFTIAQSCGPNEILLKNDSLPDVPSGPTPVSVIRGLCDGTGGRAEAAMSVFRNTGAVKINKVSVMFGHIAGVSGATAVADVEIYDDATFQPGGTVTLGNLVYRHSSVTSSSIQLSSHAINELDLSAQNIVVSTGTVVVAWRMEINSLNGDCTNGYSANVCTDNAQTACAGACPRGKNIIDERTNGPIDPAAFTLGGFPLCSCFYAGNFIIRACVEPQINLQWTGNATPGGVLSLRMISPSDPLGTYFIYGSGAATTGITIPGFATLPLDPDLLFLCFLNECRPLLIGGFGNLNAMGEAFGGLIIPNTPALANSNFPMYLAFWTGTPTDILNVQNVSPPSQLILIN